MPLRRTAYPGSLKASNHDLNVMTVIAAETAYVGQRFILLELDARLASDAFVVSDISGTWLHPQDSTP